MTGFFMIVVLIIVTYLKVNPSAKAKMNYLLIAIATVMFMTWSYTSSQTDGLIEKDMQIKMLQEKLARIDLPVEEN